MATIVIGGEEIHVALSNFEKLEAAWQYVQAVRGAADQMAGARAVLGIIAVGTRSGEWTVKANVESQEVEHEIERLRLRLKPVEILPFTSFVNELMIECGMAKPVGEATPAEGAANPSTETSSASSTSSSPPAAEASPTSA